MNTLKTQAHRRRHTGSRPLLAAPDRPGVSRAETRARLEALKERLLRRYLEDPRTGDLAERLRWAAADAASLAWATAFPLLVLPELVEEKLEAARRQAARQERIRRRSAALLARTVAPGGPVPPAPPASASSSHAE